MNGRGVSTTISRRWRMATGEIGLARNSSTPASRPAITI
jgi:hypothetical protein